jgi:regulator of sigma E protease
MDSALQDRLAIVELVQNWALWRDAGDWERFRTVWHDDGWMTATWFQGPAEKFIAVSRAGFDKGVNILHFLGGSSVELQGARAVAQTKMTISQRASVDGVPVETWEGLVREIRAHPEQTLRLAVVRDDATLSLEVRPEAVEANGERIGRIGAAPRIPTSHADRMLVRVHYGPLESLLKAAGKTYDIAVFSLRMIGKMLLGEVSWRHLSGPVTIADFAGQSAQLGWIPYVNFLALISISLGVLNLLPIPLLDGGHLMYYTVEIIKGSPVSERAMELGQRVGLTLLLVMMAFAFYNDLNRLLSG